MNKVNIIITVAIAALTISVWAWINRPDTEPPWPAMIQGFSFSPMRADDNPMLGNFPTAQEIEEDLILLKGKTHAVRTYTMEGTLAEVPALAGDDPGVFVLAHACGRQPDAGEIPDA